MFYEAWQSMSYARYLTSLYIYLDIPEKTVAQSGLLQWLQNESYWCNAAYMGEYIGFGFCCLVFLFVFQDLTCPCVSPVCALLYT